MSLIRKLRRQPEAPDNHAADDWAPVPATATAAPSSWGDWLEEPEERREVEPRVAQAPLGDTGEQPAPRFGIALVGHLAPQSRQQVAAKPPASAPESGYEGSLTPEERAIIARQRADTAESAKASVAPPMGRVAPIPVRPKPSVRKPADKARYHQYLTPEEQRILQAQQSGRLRRLTGKLRAPRRPRTDEIVKDLGTHLTDEERQIIERQLG